MGVETNLRKKLIRKAHMHKKLQATVLPLVQSVPRRILTGSQRFDLVEAIRAASGKDAAGAPRVPIEKMPGFSPMQLRQQINRIAEVRQELEIMATEYESVLSKMKDLEKEEKKGLKALNDSAKQMREKGKYCVEAEKALLQFTAHTQEKRPGIEQMLSRPEETKWGDKAGDFFGRIAQKLGAEIAKDVETIYTQCKDDLTHTADAVRAFKVITKTSSLPSEVVKTAGLVDAIVSVKEWLAGQTNSLAKRILNFAGDIGRWVKEFVVRTKLVGNATGDLKKALDSAKKDVDKLLAGA